MTKIKSNYIFPMLCIYYDLLNVCVNVVLINKFYIIDIK